ncbi:TniQ family protein (plasmid) [Sphingobium sp. WTD-1]|mgnify:CR=1 FL=1|uniref:TniQ family protein n=1 Tax=Alphaproteobacteria TaxID=28211 RepID=UPI0024DE729D|nr:MULTISPECIES: TniQ family protein [Alphaproteobacteria]MCK9553422.1 TniQ family protein [Aquamicrobium sp.]WIA58893.1 TniQ family protein [Sphingobium sp. WTD-1]WIA59279.1 TniQ family protein [Sphingobium sp. WTD-1]
MWRSELYATEVHEKLVTPNYALPVYTAPIAGEALLSWLCRLAAMTGQSPLAFARQAFGIDSVRQPEWWRRPSADQRSVLLAISGLPPEQFDDMTLERWSTARNDENDRRFSPIRMIYPKQRERAARTLFACAACLAEDETPYLRREWLIGWQAVCARHRTVLMRRCPHCRWKLSSQWLRDKEPVDLHRCKRCGGLLAGANGPPAIDGAIDLQAAMLGVKRRGSGEIPGLGIIQWETFTVIVDLVLRLVWIDAGDHARETLLAELVRDLSLAPDARFTIDWKGNYGALVLMAWMIADWPVRLRRALELLAAPRVDDLLGQVHDLSEASRMRARTRMRDVLNYQSRTMDWRLWLHGLVEGGTDFRRRARAENVWPRKDRLIALALLSEGRAIEEAAFAVRVSTNMIKRWLEVGMAYGVEAVLEKPLRICDLTPVQIDEIAAWLTATERTSGGPLKWSREHTRSEIMARFGLRITTNAAYQLLLNNKPRHKGS